MASEAVNLDFAVSIGKSQLRQFRDSWPQGFYGTLSKKVVNFDVKKKHIKVGDQRVVDHELIYARAIGLLISTRTIDFSDVLSRELAPYPTSMFDEEGLMRVAKAKSSLKNKLHKVVSARSCHTTQGSVIVIDAAAMGWTLNWPAKAKVEDLVANMNKNVAEQKSDVYLFFYRYYSGSTKAYTRMLRTESGSKIHKLHLQTPLPSREVCLTVAKNKEQLYDMFVNNLTDPETAPLLRSTL